MNHLVAEIEKRRGLGCHAIPAVLFAQHQRGTAQPVTGGVNPFFSQKQHAAGTLHLCLHAFNAVHEIVALADQHAHEFSGVDLAFAGFGKMNAPIKGVGCQLGPVVDFRHGGNAESPQVGSDNQRLGIIVADYADALVSLQVRELGLEFRPEIAVFNILDGLCHAPAVFHSHSAPFGAQVGMVIRSVKQIHGAVRLQGASEQSAHICKCLRLTVNDCFGLHVPLRSESFNTVQYFRQYFFAGSRLQ